MTLPEWLLLGALWTLAPGSWQLTWQAAGTHVRTREGVWGSPFLGWSLQVADGSLQVTDESLQVGRQPGCVAGLGRGGAAPSTAIGWAQPPQMAQKLRGSLLPGC